MEGETGESSPKTENSVINYPHVVTNLRSSSEHTIRAACPPKRLSRGWRICSVVINGSAMFFNVPSSFFRAERSGVFFLGAENVQLWIKRCSHNCHFLVSQPIRGEEGLDYRLLLLNSKLILLVSCLYIMFGETFTAITLVSFISWKKSF